MKMAASNTQGKDMPPQDKLAASRRGGSVIAVPSGDKKGGGRVRYAVPFEHQNDSDARGNVFPNAPMSAGQASPVHRPLPKRYTGNAGPYVGSDQFDFPKPSGQGFPYGPAKKGFGFDRLARG